MKISTQTGKPPVTRRWVTGKPVGKKRRLQKAGGSEETQLAKRTTRKDGKGHSLTGNSNSESREKQ